MCIRDSYYYITVMNENYVHPPMPKGAETGILKGLYLLKKARRARKATPRVRLMGSGTILNEALAAGELLMRDYGVQSDIWSVTSFNELTRDGRAASRHNRYHPEGSVRNAYVTQCLENDDAPVIAATDYVQSYADQIREFVPARYVVLGTDGFGRSGTRAQLRQFFEVNRWHIALAALKALADEGQVPPSTVSDAIKQYSLDSAKPDPARI